MTQSMDRLDRLVEDYLGAVSYACVDLPPDQRDDLLGDLRAHIEAARGVLYQPTEAAVRTILDRLGEPTAIAAEARLGEPLAPNTTTTTASPPARSPEERPPNQNRLISRPMPPVVFGVLLALVFIVTVLVLGAVVVMLAGR